MTPSSGVLPDPNLQGPTQQKAEAGAPAPGRRGTGPAAGAGAAPARQELRIEGISDETKRAALHEGLGAEGGACADLIASQSTTLVASCAQAPRSPGASEDRPPSPCANRQAR